MAARKWLAGILVVLCVLALASAPAAHARSSNANTAALQVALKALRHYNGGIDGIAGRRTKRAIRRFQRSRRLPADGVAGPRTRARARPPRPAAARLAHPQAAAAAAGTSRRVQFMLRRRGFSPGSVDGGYGAGDRRRRQALPGRARPARPTAASGARRCARCAAAGGACRTNTGTASGPVRFLRPVRGAMGDGFGWVSGRNHTGIDFPQPAGTYVGAAGRGTVTFAGWNSGGYGNLMVVRHRLGFETWYAHLSGFAAGTGAGVAGGTRIGYVGSTGRSTGPHLHWEVRRNGVPINPMPYR